VFAGRKAQRGHLQANIGMTGAQANTLAFVVVNRFSSQRLNLMPVAGGQVSMRQSTRFAFKKIATLPTGWCEQK